MSWSHSGIDPGLCDLGIEQLMYTYYVVKQVAGGMEDMLSIKFTL